MKIRVSIVDSAGTDAMPVDMNTPYDTSTHDGVMQILTDFYEDGLQGGFEIIVHDIRLQGKCTTFLATFKALDEPIHEEMLAGIILQD